MIAVSDHEGAFVCDLILIFDRTVDKIFKKAVCISRKTTAGSLPADKGV